MTDHSNTGPEGVDPEFAPDGLGTGGLGDEGLGTDLPGDDADRTEVETPGRSTAAGTQSNAEVEEKAADGDGRQGPMVDDASIDWRRFDGADSVTSSRSDATDDDALGGGAPLP